MKQPARILGAFLALLIVGCQNPGGGGTDNAPKVGSLVGTVSASDDSSVEGAEVWLTNTSLRTLVDADGHYSLSNIPPGTHTLNVAKSGYQRFSDPSTIITASVQTKQTAIVLEPLTSDETITLSETSAARSWGFSRLDADLTKERLVTLDYTVPAGGGDVYYLLTNVQTAGISTFGGSASSVQSSASLNQKPAQFNQEPLFKDLPGLAESGWRAFAAARSSGSGRSLSAATSPVPTVLAEGAKTTFIDALWYDGSPNAAPGAANQHASTLRKVVVKGTHRLNIWVSDAAWDSNGWGPTTPSAGLSHGVRQIMVDALADRFMKDSGTADIYSWVTALYGEEWPASGVPTGSDGSSFDGQLINGGGQVNIFLVNLNPGGTANGVLMGYFHSLNNVVAEPGSNGKVLFALDASSLANPSDGNPSTPDAWDIEDFWPAEIVSTLAHEFQHMIHFYQKQVKHTASLSSVAWTDTWIDEMASLITEDLVADKLGIAGPRGVMDNTSGSANNTEGRMPRFNYFHEILSLTSWGSIDLLASYSNSYAFGAWLLRNYGGPQLFRDIVTGDGTDYRAVVNAVNANNGADPDVTFASLVRDWGLATFVAESGNRAGLNYQSATGFNWTLGAQSYTVGSIDPWKYRIFYGANSVLDGPWVSGDGVLDSSRWVGAGATYYHWAGPQTAGNKSVKLTLPPGVVLTLVVKP